MTWPEVKAAAARPCVAIVPIATLEDHGLHLPIDTDLLLCASVCELAAARAPDRIVLVPPINHGYTPHHMDFPGAITIGAHTLIDYGLDVCKSLAHHGFERILIVNGHGSNAPFIGHHRALLRRTDRCARGRGELLDGTRGYAKLAEIASRIGDASAE